MIFDGMVPNIASVVRRDLPGAGQSCRICRVNAGSETFPGPCPACSMVSGSWAMVLSGLLLPAGMEHCLAPWFAPPERSMGALATDGNRIATLDWRPAFEVYQEIIKAQFGD